MSWQSQFNTVEERKITIIVHNI